jgi:hypothetical protein
MRRITGRGSTLGRRWLRVPSALRLPCLTERWGLLDRGYLCLVVAGSDRISDPFAEQSSRERRDIGD